MDKRVHENVCNCVHKHALGLHRDHSSAFFSCSRSAHLIPIRLEPDFASAINSVPDLLDLKPDMTSSISSARLPAYQSIDHVLGHRISCSSDWSCACHPLWRGFRSHEPNQLLPFPCTSIQHICKALPVAGLKDMAVEVEILRDGHL